MRAGVVVFPGTNCETETFYVLKDLVGFDTYYIWHEETSVDKFSLVVLPGGFSYGDYLRPGAMAKVSPVMEAIGEYVEKEKGLVLGICNGFQILTEAGLLIGGLIRNKNLKFICKDVSVKIVNNELPLTQKFEKDEALVLPIAHMDGRFVAHQDQLNYLVEKNLIFLKYEGENPNGSLLNIAGITNEKKNVFGMMPHPERNSEKILGTGDGLKFFLSIKEYLENG
ncbi:MAG: phosphoribosylformylglycinamidine synthase subunit PurQ [bacterium]|nr:phosphoribosylformylglycinamidine synthase subunit PurQ [bacterium]